MKLGKVFNLLGLALTLSFSGCGVNAPSFNPSAGVPFSGQITTVVFDSNDDPSNAVVTIDWGDGVPVGDMAGGPADLSGLAVNGPDIDTTSGSVGSDNGTGNYPVFGSHTYAVAGTYTVTVSVSDSDFSASDSNSGPIIVDTDYYQPSPSPLVAIQTLPFSGTVLAFSDNNGARLASELSAVVDWGDSTTPSPEPVAGGSGAFTVAGSHSYADNGPFTVTVTVQHVGGNAVPLTVDMNVAPLLSLSNFITTAPAGAPVGTVATLTDLNPAITASGLQASIFFSDGFTDKAIITGSNGQFTVSSSHGVAVREGSIFGVNLTVSEIVSGASISMGGPVTVTDGLLAASPKIIQAEPGVAWTGAAGAFYDSDGLSSVADYRSVSIDWGDGSAASAGTVVPNGVVGYFAVTGSHTWAAASSHPFVVSINVLDSGGSSVVIKSQAFVSASLVKVAGDANTVGAGVASLLDVAEFVVLDQNATVADFAATIDWGDGSAASGGTITGGGGAFSVSGTHTYAKSGAYTTQITVSNTQPGGGSGSANGTTTVNQSGVAAAHAGSIEEYVGVQFAWQFSFTDKTPGRTSGSYQVKIDWGDSTTPSSGTITGSAGNFSSSAPHSYAAAGNDVMMVTILDAASGESLATFQVMVSVVTPSGEDGGATNGGHSSSSGCSLAASASNANSVGLLLLLAAVALLLRRRPAR